MVEVLLELNKTMVQDIKIAQILQQYTDNKEIVSVEGSTIRECLNNLVKQYPETRKWIPDANKISMIIVLLNKELVLPDKMDQKVSPTDKIELVPVIAGG
jgi:molybdopterin converting factor small subunit